MYAPERIALECLIDADAHGAAIANHLAAERLLLHGQAGGRRQRARCDEWRCRFDIRARLTLVAAGPWADLFLEHATGKPAHHRLLRSKGIHLLLPEITQIGADHGSRQRPFLCAALARPHPAGHHRHANSAGDRNASRSAKAISTDFLALVNRYLPAADLTREQVEFFYAGLRPLVDDGSGQTYNASRRSELVDHARDDGVDGLFSALGGKWTTSRHLAETITDAA